MREISKFRLTLSLRKNCGYPIRSTTAKSTQEDKKKEKKKLLVGPRRQCKLAITLQHFLNPKSVGIHLMCLRNLQRFQSHFIYLRHNVHRLHLRLCHNLPDTTLYRVPDVVPAARLKNV